MELKRRQPIGVELVKRGVVKEEDIERALDYQKEHPNVKIGDCLYELEACDPYILITTIGEILGEKGILLSKSSIKINIVMNRIFDILADIRKNICIFF